MAITQVEAIHGMGGVGKTQLAARYARTHRDSYDVVWWLRAEREQTLRADLGGLAVALGLVPGDRTNKKRSMPPVSGYSAT